MERSVGLLLVLIATLAITHLIQAQSQQGFISLDCGLPASELSPYNESETGLQFSSDATFIQSGTTGNIQANRESEFLKPSWTLRYFPEGRRNCYNLNVEKGRNHLIRARFVYGNYDGRNIGPKFDMYLGPNLWVTIDMEMLVNAYLVSCCRYNADWKCEGESHCACEHKSPPRHLNLIVQENT